MVGGDAEIGWAHGFEAEQKVQGVGAGITQLHSAPSVPHLQTLSGISQPHVFGEQVLPHVGGVGTFAARFIDARVFWQGGQAASCVLGVQSQVGG